MGGSVRLESLPLGPACFFLTLLLLPCFFALSFCESDFAWSSDGVLLVGATRSCIKSYFERAPSFLLEADDLERG